MNARAQKGFYGVFIGADEDATKLGRCEKDGMNMNLTQQTILVESAESDFAVEELPAGSEATFEFTLHTIDLNTIRLTHGLPESAHTGQAEGDPSAEELAIFANELGTAEPQTFTFKVPGKKGPGRIVVPRGKLTVTGAINFSRTDYTKIPCRIRALDPEDGSPVVRFINAKV